jgi:hypothetical protein
MFGLFIALLVASTSSAEERALGTTDMQRLQPWPFWKLCLVRLATVGLIALFLGLAVPIGLEAALPLIDGSGWTVGPTFGSIRFLLPKLLSNEAATLLLMALFSCYVSTLCVGGLRALLVALPSSFTLVSLYLGLLSAIGQLESKVLATMYPPPPCTLPGAPDIVIPGCRQSWWDGLSTVSNTDFMTTFLYSRRTTTVAFIGFAALILFLYVRNSRTGEGGAPLAKKQLLWVAAYVALAAVVTGGGSSLLQWWLFTH